MGTALAPPAPPAPPSALSYRLSAANTPTAPAVLRDLVVALCRSTGHGALAGNAQLCASEIVTNVYRHTAARLVHVDVIVAEGYVSVWVHDDLPKELPGPPEGLEREGGLGLCIVDQLADHWGAALYGGLIPTSKAVWFRLDEGGRGVV
ncbi:ATP-binding protein [Streptomyces prunicolor]|uniref:ATP-binding protein n=1 Tax=Streptomyces prunicolor TaxID=67348 RepID=UPI00343D7963